MRYNLKKKKQSQIAYNFVSLARRIRMGNYTVCMNRSLWFDMALRLEGLSTGSRKSECSRGSTWWAGSPSRRCLWSLSSHLCTCRARSCTAPSLRPARGRQTVWPLLRVRLSFASPAEANECQKRQVLAGLIYSPHRTVPCSSTCNTAANKNHLNESIRTARNEFSYLLVLAGPNALTNFLRILWRTQISY